jgi:hypothetical protein
MVEFQNDVMSDAKADAMAITSAFRAASVSQIFVYFSHRSKWDACGANDRLIFCKWRNNS